MAHLNLIGKISVKETMLNPIRDEGGRQFSSRGAPHLTSAGHLDTASLAVAGAEQGREAFCEQFLLISYGIYQVFSKHSFPYKRQVRHPLYTNI